MKGDPKGDADVSALELEMSKVREQLNAPEAPAEAKEAELRTQYVDLERRWRDAKEAAAKAAAEAQPDFAEKRDADTAEGAEIRALVAKAEIRNYMAAALGDPLRGAEAELNAALKLRGGITGAMVPWEVLAPVVDDDAEERADANTVAPATLTRQTRPIIPRVFASGATAYLGVGMPSVGTGEQVWHYLSAGTTAAQKAKGDEQDSSAAVFSAETLKPIRLSARYTFALEDLAVLAGMEAALRADLRATMTEQMDIQVLNGDGDAPNVAGFLATAAKGGLADVANNSAAVADGAPNAVVNAAALIGSFASLVDGRYATMPSDSRVVIGPATYAKLSALKDGDVYVFDRVMGRTRVNAHIPAAAANVQQAVAAKVGAPGLYAVAPVWQGLEIIRDPYTAAKAGEIAITAIALWNFQIIRAAGFKRLKYKLAA